MPFPLKLSINRLHWKSTPPDIGSGGGCEIAELRLYRWSGGDARDKGMA